MFFEIFNFFLRIGKYTGRSVRGASGHREHRRGRERSNKCSSVCVIFEWFFFLGFDARKEGNVELSGTRRRWLE